MQKKCRKCDGYLIPYLKTGELKSIDNVNISKNTKKLTSYQLEFCVHCKIVYYRQQDRYEFLPLEVKPKKGVK